MATQPESTTCTCGTEMELRQSGTQKAMPLIGSEIDYRIYACPDCGAAIRYEKQGGEWERVGTESEAEAAL